ncbi:ABC transporter permease [Enterococcus sp. CWB-B31]|uniref:ABC transporter permease n=1 Tax=Enterococcus sp. CWB-B31 TaxID=2885159 RepID=UPI001E497866|nr:ABC transporter permease [Enterococcus sp. CWB-B31]MCB5955555.1 ABC transporter permease [Enterococcus sp. CWB-B31]
MKKRFLLKKTLHLLISLLFFTGLLYGLLYVSTGDPALGVLRRSGGQNVSLKTIEETRRKLGIDGNFFEQYFHWLGNILKGDFGYSFMTNVPVLQIIGEKASVTFKLLGISFIFSTIISLGSGSIIGNFSSLKWVQQILSVVLSFPIYWLSLVLIFILGVQLKWLPFVGSNSGKHLILPVMVICLSEGSYLTKMVSDLITLVSGSESQRIAKFRGVKWYYRFSYQLKESFVPLISLYGNSFTHLFGGTVMVEIIFSIAGLGKLLMEAISTRDYPVIQGITLFVACSTFLLNYIVDVFIQKVDSRIQINQGGAK